MENIFIAILHFNTSSFRKIPQQTSAKHTQQLQEGRARVVSRHLISSPLINRAYILHWRCLHGRALALVHQLEGGQVFERALRYHRYLHKVIRNGWRFKALVGPAAAARDCHHDSLQNMHKWLYCSVLGATTGGTHVASQSHKVSPRLDHRLLLLWGTRGLC